MGLSIYILDKKSIALQYAVYFNLKSDKLVTIISYSSKASFSTNIPKFQLDQ